MAQSPVVAVEGAAALVNPVQVPQRAWQHLLLDALHCRIACACTMRGRATLALQWL